MSDCDWSAAAQRTAERPGGLMSCCGLAERRTRSGPNLCRVSSRTHICRIITCIATVSAACPAMRRQYGCVITMYGASHGLAARTL